MIGVRGLSTVRNAKTLGTAGRLTEAWPVMDFKAMRELKEQLKHNARLRGSSVDVEEVLDKHQAYVDVLAHRQNLEAKRKVLSKLGKNASEQEQEERVVLKEQLASAKELEEQLLKQAFAGVRRIPNWTHPDVPIGGEDQAREIKVIGKKPEFEFVPKDHTELLTSLGWYVPEAGITTSGSRFAVLKGMGAALELALVSWAVHRVSAKGFELLFPPDMVLSSWVERCGFLPDGEEVSNRHVYNIQSVGEEEEPNLSLAGTAEIPLMSMFFDQLLRPEQLPKKVMAVTHCFRPEVGHASREARGLYRLHQFTKVEMVALCLPGQSEALHRELLDIELELFDELGLHVRAIDMPTEDLGAPAYRKFDCEAWMPGRNSWGEISSTSNCTDFQTRRLNVRTKIDSERVFVHSLNGTACAVPRMIIAIAEQFQQSDGTIKIPSVLHPYLSQLGFSHFLV